MVGIIKEFTNCKEPFRAGMVFRSEEHPEKDLIVESVFYTHGDSMIEWSLVNPQAFDAFLKSKKRVSESTYPYPVAGGCKHSSFKTYLKKYGLELCKTESAQVCVSNDCFKEVIEKNVMKEYNEDWHNCFD